MSSFPKEDKEPYPLPLKVIHGNTYAKEIALIEREFKRQAAHLILGTPYDFKGNITKILEQVHNEAYARGVKTSKKIDEL